MNSSSLFRLLLRTAGPGAALVIASGSLGCSDEAGSNAPPHADAGGDQYGAVGIEVSLDGSGSQDTDDENATLTYRWAVERAPAGSSLSGGAPFQPNESEGAATTSFTPDVEGLFIIRLTVNDGDLDGPSDFAVVEVDASALLPIAVAGTDQTATEGDDVVFDGSKSQDPLGGSLTWLWTLVTVPERSSLPADGIEGADTASPQFTPDAPGQYLASLTVTNAVGTSFPDFVAVEVASTNAPPTADISPATDLWTCFDSGVTGADSSDPDADPLTYDWRVLLAPYGSTVVEQPWDDPTAMSPTFFPDVPGTYLVQLVVNDGETNSAPAQSFLEVVPRPDNEIPVANAGSDKFFDDSVTCTGGSCPDCEDKVVELDAAAEGSYDPDGDPLTYEWKVTEGNATVLDPYSPSTSVTLDQADAREGYSDYYVYKVQLIMTDCLGDTNDTTDPDATVSFTYQCTGT